MNSIFHKLSNEEIQEIYNKSEVVSIAKGGTLFQEDDIPSYLYVLLEGKVAIYDNLDNGKINLVALFSNKYDCFGEVFLFLNKRYDISAHALKKTKVMRIRKSELIKYNQLYENVVHMIAQKAYYLSHKIKVLSNFSLKDRILWYVENHQYLKLNRREMAEYIGVTRPALSKMINQMQDEGIIEIDESGFIKCVNKISKS